MKYVNSLQVFPKDYKRVLEEEKAQAKADEDARLVEEMNQVIHFLY